MLDTTCTGLTRLYTIQRVIRNIKDITHNIAINFNPDYSQISIGIEID